MCIRDSPEPKGDGKRAFSTGGLSTDDRCQNASLIHHLQAGTKFLFGSIEERHGGVITETEHADEVMGLIAA